MRQILSWLLFGRTPETTAVRQSMHRSACRSGIADRANGVVTATSALWRQIRLVCLMVALPALPCALDAQTPQTEPAATPKPAQMPTPSQEPTPAPPAALPEQNAPAVETPGAIYKDAMRPLEVVRMSLDNWSDAELGALGVGMHKAKEACDQAKPESYSGDDLYDLARLCSFGQDWNAANTAALDYVAGGLDAHRAQAYALSMNALVHINAVDLAVGTAHEMLRKLPYDAEVAYAVRYMKETLEQAGDPAALTLAAQEHPAIVQALALGTPLKAAHGDAVIGVGPLYESAMQMAFFERYAGDDAAAAGTVADVAGALPKDAVITAEDKQRINTVTTQYGLLGARLPAIDPSRSLMSATAKAQVNPDFGAATVLVLFPDWCVQCRNMMKTLTAFVVANREVPIHAYGLMFPDESVTGAQPLPEAKMKEMQGTATLLVPAETAATFAALDYPLGIVADKAGLIRFIGVVPGDAFNGDGYIDKVITRMAGKTSGPPKTE
jgi:hypothetical protein